MPPADMKSINDWRESNSDSIIIGSLVRSNITEQFIKEDSEVWKTINIEYEFEIELVLKGAGQPGDVIRIYEKHTCQNCSSDSYIKKINKLEGNIIKVFLVMDGQSYRFNRCFTSIEIHTTR